MNFKFRGINISSNNPEKTFEFYKKLGFRVLEECEPDDQWYGATFALQDDKDEPVIWIWRRQDGDEMVVKNNFVFGVDGKLEETYHQFKAAGIECDPPVVAVWGGQELTLTDPDGNSLLFL